MPLRELTDRKIPDKLTDNEVNIRIMPRMARWPSLNDAKTIAWDKSREAAELLRVFVHTLDDLCLQVERNNDLLPAAIARRVTALGARALTELNDWAPLRVAEREVIEPLSNGPQSSAFECCANSDTVL